LVNFLVFYV